MNRIFRSAVLLAALAFAVPAPAADTQDPATQPPILLGAYTPVPVDAPDVQDAKAFVQDRLPSLDLVDVKVAYTQVVAGLNIKLISNALDAGRQETWKFVVYRDLEGRMALALAERL